MNTTTTDHFKPTSSLPTPEAGETLNYPQTAACDCTGKCTKHEQVDLSLPRRILTGDQHTLCAHHHICSGWINKAISLHCHLSHCVCNTRSETDHVSDHSLAVEATSIKILLIGGALIWKPTSQFKNLYNISNSLPKSEKCCPVQLSFYMNTCKSPL